MQAPMKHAIDVRNAFEALTVDVDVDDLENVTVPDNATKVWNMHTEQSEQTIAPPSSPITKLDFEISDFPFEISDFPLEISATRDPSQVRGRAPVSITDLIVNRESQSARRQARKRVMKVGDTYFGACKLGCVEKESKDASQKEIAAGSVLCIKTTNNEQMKC